MYYWHGMKYKDTQFLKEVCLDARSQARSERLSQNQQPFNICPYDFLKSGGVLREPHRKLIHIKVRNTETLGGKLKELYKRKL